MASDNANQLPAILESLNTLFSIPQVQAQGQGESSDGSSQVVDPRNTLPLTGNASTVSEEGTTPNAPISFDGSTTGGSTQPVNVSSSTTAPTSGSTNATPSTLGGKHSFVWCCAWH